MFHILAQVNTGNAKAHLTALGVANVFGAFGSIFLAAALFDAGVRLQEHSIVIYTSEPAHIQKLFFNGIAGLFSVIALFCLYKALNKFKAAFKL